MTGPVIEIKANEAARSKAEISVSVLIPFYNDDPTPLVNALAETAPVGVEAILFDDGCPDAALNAQVSAAIAKVSLPVRLMTSKLNQGRSGARNRLAGSALGALIRPARADLVAALGETTGEPALRSVLRRMKQSSNGKVKR